MDDLSQVSFHRNDAQSAGRLFQTIAEMQESGFDGGLRLSRANVVLNDRDGKFAEATEFTIQKGTSDVERGVALRRLGRASAN